MPPLLYQWIDLLWVPVALFMTHKGHRVMGMAFVLSCVFTLRLQVELMDSIGFPDGILGLIHADAFKRGLIVWGILIGLFLLLARLSPNAFYAVFMAAALTIYFLAFTASTVLMVL
jgi:hypothetical protein